MKKILLLTLVLAFATSCDFLKDKLRAHWGVESAKLAVEEVAVTPVAEPTIEDSGKVYSYAYDGFVNMRAYPSYKSTVIGKFRNGPEGAILLEDRGEWTKIDIDGVVGYVPSKYVCRQPTVAYTGRVGVDWLEGQYGCGSGFQLRIYNNGFWEYGYNFGNLKGYYIMQNSEIKLVTVLEFDFDTSSYKWTGARGLPNEEGWILKIDARSRMLRDEGGLGFQRFEFDKDVDEDMWDAVDKASFRYSGKYAADEVNAYLRK